MAERGYSVFVSLTKSQLARVEEEMRRTGMKRSVVIQNLVNTLPPPGADAASRAEHAAKLAIQAMNRLVTGAFLGLFGIGAFGLWML